ncbi:MAG: hypothetical protein JSW71_01015, partial [Gemmatimonadota bacterium]
DARNVAVDGDEIRARGYIQHPGGVQWYRLAEPGNYEIRVADAGTERSIRTELYAERDISRPLESRSVGTRDRARARQYTLLGPGYLRVGNPWMSVPGEYTLQIRRAG